MSPEQAINERDIDARTDIYALGAVTYDMLTGQPEFTRATDNAIVAKVLTDRPSPPPPVHYTIPPAVEHAVCTALAKLPAHRWRLRAGDGLLAPPSNRRAGPPYSRAR
jgi:serine/threonine protein kinase